MSMRASRWGPEARPLDALGWRRMPGHSHDHHHHGLGHHHDHGPAPGEPIPPGYRKVLWVALVVNAAMFLLEVGAGLSSGSISLLADAIDFFSDAANYALSVAVLAMGALARARAAMFKAATMVLFGAL